jgi:DegV family protein with EDD domain
MNIGIVTDTGCNISPAEAEQLNIHLVPLELIFDGVAYADGFELSIAEFYKMMEASESVPTSSQPTYGAFYEMYQEIVDQYDKIISIHLSSKISGAVETARMAANDVDGSKISIFDTELVSVLSRNLVLEAKKLIDAGQSYEQIIKTLEYGKERSVAYILFGSLENVTKSGRVPGLVGKFSELVQIKPIVKVSTDGFEVEKMVRTSKRAFKTMKSFVSNYIDTLDDPYIVEVAHGDILKRAEDAREELLQKYPEQKGDIHQVAGVVGVHSGPDLIGFAITPDFSEIDI